MKNTLFCLKMPKNGAYVGGVAVIVNQYIEHKNVFNGLGYNVGIIDTSESHRNLRVNKKIANIIHLFNERRYVIQQVENENPDVLHIHSSRKWTLLKDLVIANSIRKRFSGKMVLSLHFAEIDKILYHDILLKKYQLRKIKKCFDNVIFLSRETECEFVNLGILKDNSNVLYTFHDFNYPVPMLDSRERKINLLFVGSIDRRKGICDLLKALTRIESPLFTLHVCGQFVDGEVEQEFNDYAEKMNGCVIFHGYVSGDKKIEIFEKSDILVLPSYGEGMPIVIMEALAAGCAIISTKVGAIPEIITNRNGTLIDPGDIDALSNALLLYARDREVLNTTKMNNYELSTEFNIESNIVNLCKIYDR